MTLDTDTHNAISDLAALPLGGEAMFRGVLIRKVLVVADPTIRCGVCPLYKLPRPAGGDLCDRWYMATRAVRPCIPAGAPVRDDVDETLVPVSDIPKLALKGYLV